MRNIFLIFIILFITSCGFHLRGEANFAQPLHNLYIKTPDPYGQLTKNLQHYFKQSDINVVSDSKDATTVLEIISEQESQHVVSTSGTQLTRQYSLILTVNFQLLDASTGIPLTPLQTVTQSRSLTVQTNQILAGSNESSNLYHEMRRAIVFDIANRMASRDITTMINAKTRSQRMGT